MIFLLVEIEEDRLMTYQHTKRSNFVTRAGVDKLFGAQAAMARLGLDLAHCVGAGDTPMDNFLKGVGLAVPVGPLDLEFHGLQQTVRIRRCGSNLAACCSAWPISSAGSVHERLRQAARA